MAYANQHGSDPSLVKVITEADFQETVQQESELVNRISEINDVLIAKLKTLDLSDPIIPEAPIISNVHNPSLSKDKLIQTVQKVICAHAYKLTKSKFCEESNEIKQNQSACRVSVSAPSQTLVFEIQKLRISEIRVRKLLFQSLSDVSRDVPLSMDQVQLIANRTKLAFEPAIQSVQGATQKFARIHKASRFVPF